MFIKHNGVCHITTHLAQCCANSSLSVRWAEGAIV